MRVRLMTAAMLILAMTIACGGASVSKRAELFVAIDNQQVQNGGSVQFSTSVGGTANGNKNVLLRNSGDKSLTITAIRLEAGGNSYITMNSSFTDASFPMVLEPNALDIEDVTFSIVYTPGTGYDDRDSELVIESNDPTNKLYKVTISPSKQAPQLKVTPANYTFVNATAAVPAVAQFTLTNGGTEQLVIDSIALQTASSEFTILDPPNKGTTIDPQGTGGIESVVFSLRCVAGDTPDENVITIRWSRVGGDIEELGIPVAGETQSGTLSITYSDQVKGYVDFSEQITTGAKCSKVINIMNQGPGPVQLKKPNIIQPSGSTAYAVKWYQGGGTQAAACGAYLGTEILGSQFGLSNQRAVDVVVEYTAPTPVGVNGTVEITYNNPNAAKMLIPLVGGSPKGEFELAPANTKLAFYKLSGEEIKTGVIVNRGTGALTIKSVTVAKAYQPDPDAFSLVTSIPENTEIAPWSLLPFEVKFTTAYDATVVNASVEITYVDPLTSGDATATLFLEGHKEFEDILPPTADAGSAADYTGAKVGETIHLDGSGSTAGSYDIWTTGYLWFLSEKPAGSKGILNLSGSGPQADFVPDVSGAYTFKMHVFSINSETSIAYFSNEASVTVQVAP